MKKRSIYLIITLFLFGFNQIDKVSAENELFSEGSENTIAVTMSDVDAEQLAAADPADESVYNAMFKINKQPFVGTIRTASSDDLMKDVFPFGNPPQGRPDNGAPEEVIPEGEPPFPPENHPEGESPEGPHGPFPGGRGKAYVIELKQDSGTLGFLIRMRPEMSEREDRPEPSERPEGNDRPKPPTRAEGEDRPEPSEMPKRIESTWTINGGEAASVQVMEIAEKE